ncbi:MAG: iron ABC transporter permease [Candidatus Tectomicrobia bacterium]|uniref:Iron ABC transporter permease n=1 Tax=Tectimicrobiota bacterium TaxID=2528274 RepID=A0A932GR79_UNCTE|nr:iron ABC transporter permease [Candidatus Tectomicrobia bacterium]
MRRAVLRRLVIGPLLDRRTVLVGISLIPVAALTVLVSVIVWISFRQLAGAAAGYSLDAYRELYLDPFTYKALLNTAVFSLITVAVALLFGIPAAWLVERTDLRPKEIPQTLMVLGLLIPSFLTGMGWVFLLNPRIGIINTLITGIPGMEWARINVATAPGMGIIQGLGLANVAFIMVSPTFRAMNPVFEEAAEVHGLRFFQTLHKVTLPLAYPGVLAAAIYIFMIGVAAFDIPAVIGLSNRVFTFSTFLYIQVQPLDGLPRHDLAGASAVLMICISLLFLCWYYRALKSSHRYAVVTGQSYRPRQVELGRWKPWAWAFLGGYFLLGQLLPLSMLVWNALLPYPQVPSLSALGHVSLNNFRALPIHQLLIGAQNTFILAVSVPTLTLLFSLGLSWVVVRSGFRSRFFFDVFSFLPHAVPHIIFAVSAAYVSIFLLSGFLPIYGTIYLLMAVYTLVWLSFATRNLNSALIQIHKELEEAAAVSGIPLLRILRKILLPLLGPALLNTWLWVALLTYRELTVASILATTRNITLPAAMWGIWLSGLYPKAAAAALLVVAVMVPLVFLYWYVGRRATAMERTL